MDNYHVLELIGEGSFGKVYKGRKKYTGQVVALKFIPKVGRSEKELKSLRREIEIMRHLKHDNIIEMLDSFETEKEVVAVTDYAEGELFQILEDDGHLEEDQVQSIACQLVSALYYLHSNRILHRDMKPQNILLGKGGVVKLCDFGFARAMSINTLVLTSIKGTPLYMSPELVEEKPYDHTADLWALGCILYELNTGQPPYYTNSIFQLVNLIIKDPVRWPKTMSPVFKDFLQGLLTKDARHRLSWPELLQHPFVIDGVTVSEKDLAADSPFTKPLSASMVKAKERQAKEKAHPPGTSKILNKARKKAAEAHKKGDAWGPDNKNTEPPPPHPDRPHTAEWEKTGASKVAEENHMLGQPTPRADRISKDYAQEFPSVEVESRRTLKVSPERKNIENVKLDGDVIDSDDEWQALVDRTEPEGEPDAAVKLMKNKAFISKLKSRLNSSSVQVLDGMLDGASRLRPVLRVIANLVTMRCELSVLQPFLESVDVPNQQLTLLSEVLDKTKVKQQPWCQQILIDLVITLNAYFGSEMLESEEEKNINAYCGNVLKFMSLLPKLVKTQVDVDLKLREQSLLCTVFLCESMERSKTALPGLFFTGIVSESSAALDAIMSSVHQDETTLKKLIELTEGNEEIACDRMNDLTDITIACLAALAHIPLENEEVVGPKREVGRYIGDKLADPATQELSIEYLGLLRHPNTCANVIKVVYSACQGSQAFCAYLANTPLHIESLLGILQGKVQVADMDLNTVLEIVLNTLSVLILQLQDVPPELANAVEFIAIIFTDSTIASHTAAAALVFSQMIHCHIGVQVQPEYMLMASLSVFTDLTQVCARCPYDFGVFDGLLLLLCQFLSEGELPMARLYIESGIWNVLWHRTAQMLQVQQTDPDIQDLEGEDPKEGFKQPDWALISPQGIVAVLQIAVSVLTKETFHCIPSLAKPDSIFSSVVMHMFSPNFLHVLSNSCPDGPQMAADAVLYLTQICCFPFAIDMNEDLLMGIYESFYINQLLPKLLSACVRHLSPEQLDMPVGLMSRLVMGEGNFIIQLVQNVHYLSAIPFFSACVSTSCPLSVICDTISICNHLARSSPDYVNIVLQIFQGNDGHFSLLEALLGHQAAVVRSRTCSMVGNMMKYSNVFYDVLQTRASLTNELIECLKDEDINVRKCSSYAIGNAAFHNSQLYANLKGAVPPLINLLSDSMAKTRSNAASALGNLAMHSSELCDILIKNKALESILEVACHDSQYTVQECALAALKSLCQQDKLKNYLKSIKAIDKLGNMTGKAAITPRPRSAVLASRSINITTVMQHCAKLIHILEGG